MQLQELKNESFENNIARLTRQDNCIWITIKKTKESPYQYHQQYANSHHPQETGQEVTKKSRPICTASTRSIHSTQQKSSTRSKLTSK